MLWDEDGNKFDWILFNSILLVKFRVWFSLKVMGVIVEF